jgi:hypothetical protein
MLYSAGITVCRLECFLSRRKYFFLFLKRYKLFVVLLKVIGLGPEVDFSQPVFPLKIIFRVIIMQSFSSRYRKSTPGHCCWCFHSDKSWFEQMRRPTFPNLSLSVMLDSWVIKRKFRLSQLGDFCFTQKSSHNQFLPFFALVPHILQEPLVTN